MVGAHDQVGVDAVLVLEHGPGLFGVVVEDPDQLHRRVDQRFVPPVGNRNGSDVDWVVDRLQGPEAVVGVNPIPAAIPVCVAVGLGGVVVPPAVAVGVDKRLLKREGPGIRESDAGGRERRGELAVGCIPGRCAGLRRRHVLLRRAGEKSGRIRRRRGRRERDPGQSGADQGAAEPAPPPLPDRRRPLRHFSRRRRRAARTR